VAAPAIRICENSQVESGGSRQTRKSLRKQRPILKGLTGYIFFGRVEVIRISLDRVYRAKRGVYRKIRNTKLCLNVFLFRTRVLIVQSSYEYSAVRAFVHDLRVRTVTIRIWRRTRPGQSSTDHIVNRNEDMPVSVEETVRA